MRRHERRKAKAEEQLTEADANLARVEDVLAELRPQARRLAAQAEQQASRQTAGREYGRAIIAQARSRWVEAAGPDLAAVVETIKRDTRRFAKRQLTWFRADPRVRWVDVTGLTTAQAADAAMGTLDW